MTIIVCDVIIVNYNAGKLITDCANSAFQAGATRVIVVDNASTDHSLAYLRTHCQHPCLTIIQNQANLGFAAACNIGISAATAEYLLFLNPDCVLEPQALHRMWEVLANQASAGMVGGLLCNPDGTEQPGGRRAFPTPKRAFVKAFGLSNLAKFFPRLFEDFQLHKQALPVEPIAVESISGACMLVKRAALKEVGLWDEGYFLHCEDFDWCMRFRLKGWHIMFVPDAKVTHVWGACSRDRRIFVEWHKHRGMLRFYRKFFRQHYPLVLWGLVVVGVWFRFLCVASYLTGQLLLNKIGTGRG